MSSKNDNAMLAIEISYLTSGLWLMRFCWIDIASDLRPKEASMRTNHTYVYTNCGKEHAKDWAYKPGHDDDPAMCDAVSISCRGQVDRGQGRRVAG